MRENNQTQPWITGVRTRIFFVSFTLLFFELLCIRWIPAYLYYLGYFTNFILLASFLGMGLGILAARRANFWFPPFPLLVLPLVFGLVAVSFIPLARQLGQLLTRVKPLPAYSADIAGSLAGIASFFA